MSAKGIKPHSKYLPPLGGKLQFYWQLIKKKVFLGFVILLVVRFYLILRYGWLVAMDRSGGYDWFFTIVIFIIIGVVLRLRKDLGYQHVAAVGGLAGLVLGGFTAVLDLLLFHNLWVLFNLIRKPLLFSVIGMAVITIVYLLLVNDDSSSKKVSKN